jgi:hypothetical protein
MKRKATTRHTRRSNPHGIAAAHLIQRAPQRPTPPLSGDTQRIRLLALLPGVPA